jgi:methionyl-tRNA formyltransferase
MEWVRPVKRLYAGDVYWNCFCREISDCTLTDGFDPRADLIVTVGWRHLVPKAVIDRTPLGVVGFHSAQLPEYPGRAPVPWAILRGDTVTHNTMLFLTDEPDAGDIIDHREVAVTTASEMNRRMGETAAEMLRQHLPALLAGTAPRTPQDRSKRGPLTKANGWQLLPEARR